MQVCCTVYILWHYVCRSRRWYNKNYKTVLYILYKFHDILYVGVGDDIIKIHTVYILWHYVCRSGSGYTKIKSILYCIHFVILWYIGVGEYIYKNAQLPILYCIHVIILWCRSGRGYIKKYTSSLLYCFCTGDVYIAPSRFL